MQQLRAEDTSEEQSTEEVRRDVEPRVLHVQPKLAGHEHQAEKAQREPACVSQPVFARCDQAPRTSPVRDLIGHG